jgi:type IV pilus assembly protein PilA
MLKRLRERAGSEKGFTLIELLVVMLILGILAAIAIPAFLSQKNKANDSQMKVQARSMETAIETYSTDNGGSYAGATANDINRIEPTIPLAAPAPTNLSGTTYTVTSQPASGSNNVFSITRNVGGTFTRLCGVGTTAGAKGQGGCRNTADAQGNYW